MPDIFDNLFGKITQSITGKSPAHYGMNSQVNTGKFYSYHENGTNNKYWMPTSSEIKDTFGEADTSQLVKPRMGSMSSVDSESKSRSSSVSE